MEWVKNWKSGIVIVVLTFLGALMGLMLSILVSAIIVIPIGLIIGKNLDEWLETCVLLLSLFSGPWMIGQIFLKDGVEFSNWDNKRK